MATKHSSKVNSVEQCRPRTTSEIARRVHRSSDNGPGGPFGRGYARNSDGRAWGLIRNEVFGTFLARLKGLFNFLFPPEWLIHFASYAGYPEAAPVWAEIRIALAKLEILPLAASLGPGRDPEVVRKRATPARGK